MNREPSEVHSQEDTQWRPGLAAPGAVGSVGGTDHFDDDSREGRISRRSPSPHGRTRMIVFPLTRVVGLKAATASARVETVPMFVRSRPSRTRWTISVS